MLLHLDYGIVCQNNVEMVGWQLCAFSGGDPYPFFFFFFKKKCIQFLLVL